MIIHVGFKELERGFKNHLGASKRLQGSSSYLLLFYAAESGLKSIWLKRNKLWKTDQIQDKTLISDGHNLHRWVKELKISAVIIKPAPYFHLDRDGSILDIEKAHQAWRYGVIIKQQDEKDLVDWLKSLCNWIEDNI